MWSVWVLHFAASSGLTFHEQLGCINTEGPVVYLKVCAEGKGTVEMIGEL